MHVYMFVIVSMCLVRAVFTRNRLLDNQFPWLSHAKTALWRS